MPAHQRGRPQRLPDDPTPYTGRHVGCEQRAAWLLASSRILHPDPAVRSRTWFVEALRARDVPADPPRISRWESGAHPAQPHVIAAYEDILGVRPGTISAVTVGMRRAFGTHVPARDQVVRDDSRDLETLLDEVQSGRGSALSWERVAGSLTRHGRVFLRRSEWDDLAHRLVDELGRSVGLGYVGRFEAAVVLLRHPSSSGPLSRALGSYVMDPDAQVLGPVLNLLAERGEKHTSELVLRLLGSDRVPLRRAAASVAADKVRRGHFDLHLLPALEEHARLRLHHEDALDGGLDALDLATQLPTGPYSRIVDSIGGCASSCSGPGPTTSWSRDPRRFVWSARWRPACRWRPPAPTAGSPTSCCAGCCVRRCCTRTSRGATTPPCCSAPAPTATPSPTRARSSRAPPTTSSPRAPGPC
ncbi:hypothetical protein [Nocardioides taihuensis]|uniref:HEAT repeat domain-containing protein n=1 Tax=Nocardioides taihuensis TaxID=1835606 RepID=A0ABW0BJA8_9ACTN